MDNKTAREHLEKRVKEVGTAYSGSRPKWTGADLVAVSILLDGEACLYRALKKIRNNTLPLLGDKNGQTALNAIDSRDND